MKPPFVVCVYFACAILVAQSTQGAQSTGLKDVLTRLDLAAKEFHSMSAKISWTKHTAVLNDDDTQNGMMYRSKGGPKGPVGLLDIEGPDKKDYAFEGRTVQVYYPAMKELQVYNLGEQGEQVEQFLMLGFGTSGSELEKTYKVDLLGEETINGQKTVHLTLIPKSAEAKKMVKQVDLWLDELRSYPVQEKILTPSGDYNLLTFGDVRINPRFKEEDLKLKLPSGVKTVYPQREK